MSTPIQKLFDLSGQTALVTGGSRGLGLQMAEALGEAGARLMLCSRKAADLEEAAAHLAERGIQADWVAADASDAAQVAARRRRGDGSAGPHRHPGQQRRRDLGRAGRGLSARGLGQGDEPQHPQPVPVRAGGRQGQHDPQPPRPHHQRRQRSPAWAAAPDVKFIAYGTSKGAVVNFTRTLAGEWGAYGITVNALAPGFFPSKMTKGVLAQFGTDKLAAAAPLQRIGDDDDLKGAALLFASAAGKHITGQILAVDGGVSAVQRRLIGASRCRFRGASRSSRSSGLELWAFGDGEAELQLALADAAHEQLSASAHGGVLMTLLDVAMAHAARSVVPSGDGRDGPGVVTIEMKTSFMRAGQGRLRAAGKLLHRTATMAFTEGSVFNAAGQLCAHATGTFKYIKAVPAAGRALKPFVPTIPDKPT